MPQTECRSALFYWNQLNSRVKERTLGLSVVTEVRGDMLNMSLMLTLRPPYDA